ncbi:Outer membrane protein (porin) [Burkholderia sp. GAS332]|nr:Outer membrane protein (porin) [Burkholderia sp. GAS332]
MNYRKIAMGCGVLLALMDNVYAQSSVTLSGILDAGLEINNAGTQKLNPSVGQTLVRFENGNLQASRLIFVGTEDLGGGMSTQFHLENQFNLGDGNVTGGTGFTREAWLALASNDGQLTMGRYRMPIFWVYLASDASTYRLDSFTSLNLQHQAALAPVFGKQTTSTSLAAAYTGLAGFSNNTVSYRSPVVAGGLQAEVAYSFGQGSVEDNTQEGKNLGANVMYRRGPLVVGYGYNDSKYSLNGSLGSLHTHAVGAFYNANFASFGADYVYARDSIGRFASSWALTTDVPAGSGQINAGVGHVNRTGATHVESSNEMDIGYVYFFSKLTSLYAFYTKIFNGSYGTTGLATINSAPSNINGYAQVTPGFNPWAATVGLRHAF